eukprot:403354497
MDGNFSNYRNNQNNNIADVSAREFDEAKETIDILQEMSQILNCGLDQRTLALLVALIENGVNPEALANVMKELKRETQALRMEEDVSGNRKQFR